MLRQTNVMQWGRFWRYRNVFVSFFWCGGRNFLTFFSFKFHFFFLNWSLLALQNCVGFCQTSTWIIALSIKASQVAQEVKNFPAIQETRGGSPWVRKTLWKREWQYSVFLPGKSHGEEPGGLQSMGLQRVRHSWTHTHTLFTKCLNICLVGWLDNWVKSCAVQNVWYVECAK